MLHFTINTKKPTKLDKLGADRIILKKIEVIPKTTVVKGLFFPIVVETSFANGEKFSYHIHPIEYFNNHIPSAKFGATNKPILRAIEYCKNTTAIIFISENKDLKEEFKNLEFQITYEHAKDLVEIYVSETFDGYAFGLSPKSKELIKKRFPKAMIANSISMARNTLHDFQTIYGTFHSYVLSALTGLNEDEVKFFAYRLLNSANNKVIYSSENNK